MKMPEGKRVSDLLTLVSADNDRGLRMHGLLTASYDTLHSILGPPNAEGDRLTSTKWVVKVRTGTEWAVATIYDYKDTDLYEDGLPSVEQLRSQKLHEWRVGGAVGVVVALARALGLAVDSAVTHV